MMSRKLKWLMLSALTAGSTMLSAGCLGAFWQGLGKTGWPGDSRWLNLAFDALKEATIYAP